MNDWTSTVPTTERIDGLERRSRRRESSGYLIAGAACTYTCPSCGTSRELGEEELVDWTFEHDTRQEQYDFECSGCGLQVAFDLRMEELPSWSSNFRAVLGHELLESA